MVDIHVQVNTHIKIKIQTKQNRKEEGDAPAIQ